MQLIGLVIGKSALKRYRGAKELIQKYESSTDLGREFEAQASKHVTLRIDEYLHGVASFRESLKERIQNVREFYFSSLNEEEEGEDHGKKVTRCVAL